MFRSLGLLICVLVAVQLILFLVRAITHFLSELELRWEGLRKFRVAEKRLESASCHSFYLTPHDGKPLPEFQPGQYLTFQLNVPGQPKKIVRCYSLSDSYRNDYYRITVKQTLQPATGAAGIASSYFNDRVQPGDILDVQAARGRFVLDRQANLPVVLLGGGIGMTPLMSMAKTLLAQRSPRRIYLFAGFTNGQQHVFKSEMEQLAAEHATLQLVVCYSNPTVADEQAVDYHVGGRIDMSLLRSQLPSSNAE